MPEKIDTSTESVHHQARSNFFFNLNFKNPLLGTKIDSSASQHLMICYSQG